MASVVRRRPLGIVPRVGYPASLGRLRSSVALCTQEGRASTADGGHAHVCPLCRCGGGTTCFLAYLSPDNLARLPSRVFLYAASLTLST